MPTTVHRPNRQRKNAGSCSAYARIEWHGGYASITDLQSASGTSVNGRSIGTGRDSCRLEHGDEVGLGPHVRFLFEHASTTAGALPAWARLSRLDQFGAGITHVLVLTEATVASSPGAAIVAPREAMGATLILRARNGHLVALRDENEMPVELFDGQRWRLGETTWTVAMHDRRNGAPLPPR